MEEGFYSEGGDTLEQVAETSGCLVTGSVQAHGGWHFSHLI